MTEFAIKNQTLRSAASGEELAKQVIAELDRQERVRIDFADVQIMTPSYANAFVMTLLAQHELSCVKDRCEFANRSDAVVDSMNRAAQRYLRGIRLSTQRPAVA